MCILHCAVFVRGKKKFKFKNKFYSLDASTIDLCLSVFPWAKFRLTKGDIKLHISLDHDGYIPPFWSITNAKPCLNSTNPQLVSMMRCRSLIEWLDKWQETKWSKSNLTPLLIVLSLNFTTTLWATEYNDHVGYLFHYPWIQ